MSRPIEVAPDSRAPRLPASMIPGPPPVMIETPRPTCASASKPVCSSSWMRLVRAPSSNWETIAAVSASSSSSSADVGARGWVRANSSSSSGVQPAPSMPSRVFPVGLADLRQVDDEDERLVRADRRLALGAVGEVGRDDEQPAAALLHPGHALVPARDDLAGAQRERERLGPAVPGGVELLAGRPRVADVLDRDDVARLRRLALAL